MWGGAAIAIMAGALVLGEFGAFGSALTLGSIWKKTSLSPVGLNLDLAAPDALIRTKSLSRLPADLLRVPLLHDLLTEDFLFYYENREGRLGLSGTLRRIAYEHDVTLSDELIKLVMDEPADVGVWRGSDGALKYYAIAMSRGKLAKLLEPAAKIALHDRQLTLADEFRVEGDTVQLFALEYGWNRKLLLASHGDRVVVFSDPNMLLGSDGKVKSSAEALLKDLLGNDRDKQQRFAKAFDLEDGGSDHSIAIKADFLSFSYQHFFPALKALRFEFSEKSLTGQQSWATAVLLNAEPARAATLLDAGALWQALPYQPSACAAMPVDWITLAKAMNSQGVAKIPPEHLAMQFEGPAAVCWYAKSRLHTPLFVAQLRQAEGADAILGAYFNYGIKAGGSAKKANGNSGDVVWQGKAAEANTQPALARSGKLVYFSPDVALVQRALAVAHKRQPALSDDWGDGKTLANTVAVIGPGQVAQLAEHEVEMSLPQQQDEVLRNAARQHLLPKLAAVKEYPSMRLELHGTPKGPGWMTVDWQQR